MTCVGCRKKGEPSLLQEYGGVNGSLQLLVRTPNVIPYWNGGPRWNGITLGLPHFLDPYVCLTGKMFLVQLHATQYIRSLESVTCRQPENRMSRDATCSSDAWNAAILENCNCSLYMMKGDNGTLCDPFTHLLCKQSRMTEIMEAHAAHKRRECGPLCSEWEYEVTMTYADLNRAWVKSVIGETNTEMNYTLLTLYYPDIGYQEIQEVESINGENLIGQVGGLMGLWTGSSLISVVQLIFYLFQFLLIPQFLAYYRSHSYKL